MNKLFKGLAIASIAMSASFAQASAPSVTLDQLLEKIKKERISEARIDKKREAEFRSARADKAALLRKAKAELAAEKVRGENLLKQHADNERRMAELEADLAAAQGDLKEAFGVVRGVAGDSTGIVAASVISAQYPGRAEELAAIGALKGLPGLAELENLWFALQTEMTESAKISTFTVPVSDVQGNTTERKVTRIGAFNLLDDNGFLVYTEDGVSELARQPEGHMLATVKPYLDSTSGYQSLFLDPARGGLLSLLTGQATLEEKYHQGETVGYIITAVLILGLLIALERVITLTLLSGKVKAQLKNPNNPGDNPLGRILKVYHSAKDSDVETLELKLDEAILKEAPRIERGISIIKVLAAIAPMLGLLGTVTGMIATFQSITLFGTGDPKMMAGGISTALVTTVLGLVAALPLMLVHALVSGRSKALQHVLEEQSVGLIAEHAEKESK
ncbi:MotA/TolQ/ExbB proton channel family protein [Psychrobium sp. MM17-31]|jgi:biopolymer transport protein ExbB|uniref:MotA/TolQ/ExbB proton channel family protein n=1 Tax=Psychrobium sp. MM17-31 TaxID=2917758 RepID=UPI001EF3F6C9|nr:MotA/TolQ/ExbB proton channel family protein [Psychrobium sp. MM17-31]MCG7530850.1 MotA/TolQ/ExbB proton channel family protein [Psychrobium sp. MM17-31]